ncbi:MAG: hypothetical protein IJA61_01735 [Clostridia bacterium]|nr:hypothetical protein [Clostridia bacterium]
MSKWDCYDDNVICAISAVLEDLGEKVLTYKQGLVIIKDENNPDNCSFQSVLSITTRVDIDSRAHSINVRRFNAYGFMDWDENKQLRNIYGHPLTDKWYNIMRHFNSDKKVDGRSYEEAFADYYKRERENEM